MDPQAAWTNILDALAEGDWPAAHQAAEALAEWLRRGGFPPRIVTELPPDHPLHRTFALTVCDEVLHATEQFDGSD